MRKRLCGGMNAARVACLLLLAPGAGASQSAAQHPAQTLSSVLRVLGLEFNVTEHPFPVTGWSPKQAVAHIQFEVPDELDAKGAHGLTSFEVSMRWAPVRLPDECVARHVHVIADVGVYLPSWVGMDEASPGHRSTWQAFEAPLRQHEYDHRDIALQAATELALAMRSARAPNCPRLMRVVAGIMDRMRESMDRAHETLDAELGRHR